MTLDDVGTLDWDKCGGLLPAIVQHARTGRVLMLGFMNDAALRETLGGGRVVFYSRSRETLWTKGETSGNYLNVVDVSTDCDCDALLVLADPIGPTCHKGTESCFADAARPLAVGQQCGAGGAVTVPGWPDLGSDDSGRRRVLA